MLEFVSLLFIQVIKDIITLQRPWKSSPVLYPSLNFHETDLLTHPEYALFSPTSAQP